MEDKKTEFIKQSYKLLLSSAINLADINGFIAIIMIITIVSAFAFSVCALLCKIYILVPLGVFISLLSYLQLRVFLRRSGNLNKQFCNLETYVTNNFSEIEDEEIRKLKKDRGIMAIKKC